MAFLTAPRLGVSPDEPASQAVLYAPSTPRHVAMQQNFLPAPRVTPATEGGGGDGGTVAYPIMG